MKRSDFLFLVQKSAACVAVLLISAAGFAQEAQRAPAGEGPLTEALKELQAQVRELGRTLQDMRAEASRTRTDNLVLRQELQETRAQLTSVERSLGELRTRPLATAPVPKEAAAGGTPEAQTSERLRKLEEDQQLLGAKLDEHYQTKVESASKYRVRLSGIMLLNVFSNWGTVDNQDLPSLALSRRPLDTGGDFGATVRQSELGLEIFGPKLASARTSAEMQFDFFGGFPFVPDGVTSGLARIRTAKLRLDWARTSLVIGQEAPFISPLSPTSLATLGVPAFSYSGNLWTWTPQIRLEHRVDLTDKSRLFFQEGILDALTGEPPYSSFYRSAQAGERSRQPAYAARIAWAHGPADKPLTLGVGGYYSRQNWGFNRAVDGWAATADWSVPLGALFSLTGELYRGRAVGGLGGGLGRSVVYNGKLTDPATAVEPLDSAGGWAQLKFKPTERLEFNGAFGQESTFAGDLRAFYSAQSYLDASLARNQSALVNFIYRPRSNLLFSVEYRHLKTFSTYEPHESADHLNLGVGVLF